MDIVVYTRMRVHTHTPRVPYLPAAALWRAVSRQSPAQPAAEVHRVEHA